jgi:hypothetical protein
VFHSIYELPFLREQKGVAGKIAGGWQLSVVAQFQTGTPFTVATGDDFAGVGPGSGSQIWQVNGDPSWSNPQFSENAADANFYFRPYIDMNGPRSGANRIFTEPARGTFTTQRVRNILYGPGFQNWTGALFKNFAITETQRVQFRGEVYNIPNHPNWDGPQTNPTNSNFGKVTGKNFERTFQLSLRYSF